VLVKICGNTDVDNLQMVLSYKPDLIGFIFFSGSPRAVTPFSEVCTVSTPGVGRVGVFVDATPTVILECVETCRLDMIQFHGNETLEVIEAIRKSCPRLKLIKAVPIGNRNDFLDLAKYENYVDMFLLDTKVGQLQGGTSQTFNWSLIENYSIQKPFLLAGGVGSHNVSTLPNHHLMAGLDVNSRVEVKPGIKDTLLLKDFFKKIRSTPIK
jgi:phosphoribosylanthranilate isomerase